MRIMVTGDVGFIGTHLTRHLLDHRHDVHGVDLRVAPNGPDGVDEYGQHVGDLLSEGAGGTSSILDHAIRHFDPDVVVHLAAQVGRLFGEDNIAHTIESNALMTARVARSCAAAFRRPRLVYTSTSEVYGDLSTVAVGCEDWTGVWQLPHNLYGLSKRWGEEVAALYALTPDLEGSMQIIRPSMPYGPGLPPGRGRAAIVNMLYQAHHRQPIPVHRGAERSWCWIEDAVRGIRLVLEQGEVAFLAADVVKRGVGCYNVGRDDAAVTMRHVAEMACAVAGVEDPDALIVEVDAPARQTVVKRLSTEKLRGLGWEPVVGLFEGMSRTYDAMKRLGQLDVGPHVLPGGTPIPPT